MWNFSLPISLGVISSSSNNNGLSEGGVWEALYGKTNIYSRSILNLNTKSFQFVSLHFFNRLVLYSFSPLIQKNFMPVHSKAFFPSYSGHIPSHFQPKSIFRFAVRRIPAQKTHRHCHYQLCMYPLYRFFSLSHPSNRQIT